MNLIKVLQNYNSNPALIYYAEDGRTELSGKVLANWLIKNLNFLQSEFADVRVIVTDLQPHFKRTVFALTMWLLESEFQILAEPEKNWAKPEIGSIFVTAEPSSDIAREFDEVLAVEPKALSLAFNSELDPFNLDWVREIRSYSDYLSYELPARPYPRVELPNEASKVIYVPQIDSAGLDTAISSWLAGKIVLTSSRDLAEQILVQEGAL